MIPARSLSASVHFLAQEKWPDAAGRGQRCIRRCKPTPCLVRTAVLREAWATLPESSSQPLPATLAQSRNLAHASLETAVRSRSCTLLELGSGSGADNVSPSIAVQREIASLLQPYFTADGLVNRCLDHAATLEHIMDFTRLRALGSLFSMINQGCNSIVI